MGTRTDRVSAARIGLAGAGAMVLAVLGGAAAAEAPDAVAVASPSAVPVLKRDQIDQLLTQPDRVVFIDLRRPDEIAAIGGLPVYLNIEISELDRFLAYVPRDRRIVTVSNHAGRAAKAAAILRDHGLDVIGAVGVENYQAEGGSLTGKLYTTAAIDGVVKANTRVEVIREGFDGTEGPVALPDGSILFTENRADRIVRIAPDGAVSTYLDKSHGANALALRANGDLIAVETAPAGIATLKPAAHVIASSYAGKPLNRPNDLALARSGSIYFSDPGAPPSGRAAPAPAPVKTALYWINPRGKVSLVADDILRPNGVALSPDERTLYVADTWSAYLLAYTVQPNGALGDRRPFARLAGFRQTAKGPSGGADGIAVDEAGRIYVATGAGVEVLSPEGAALGVIPLPKQPQNLAFGGADRAKLYVVARGSVYRIATLTKGVDRPGK